jgi:hypothetical protein
VLTIVWNRRSGSRGLRTSVLKREALFANGGALSAPRIAGKSIEELGVVVTGVNDQPDIVKFPGEDDSSAPSGSALTVPLSPAALADLKARALRVAVANASTPATQMQPPTPARPRAFDASEGTRLDPPGESGEGVMLR